LVSPPGQAEFVGAHDSQQPDGTWLVTSYSSSSYSTSSCGG
jgi:hypothetical protein